MSIAYSYIIAAANFLAGIIIVALGMPDIGRNMRGKFPWLPFGRTSAFRILTGRLVRFFAVGMLVAGTARIVLQVIGVPSHLDDAQFLLAKISFCMGMVFVVFLQYLHRKRRD
ncbi:hypothetical protein [Cupriavidus basilensis]|uniref:hypothetical protein n=1 Tax=Cupriavidus basilensis TaxID=68895 RepID=UPI001185F975|nr:hypothetical protein [Cupriavidus basilensis]